jgi:hypothetical protein
MNVDMINPEIRQFRSSLIENGIKTHNDFITLMSPIFGLTLHPNPSFIDYQILKNISGYLSQDSSTMIIDSSGWHQALNPKFRDDWLLSRAQIIGHETGHLLHKELNPSVKYQPNTSTGLLSSRKIIGELVAETSNILYWKMKGKLPDLIRLTSDKDPYIVQALDLSRLGENNFAQIAKLTPDEAQIRLKANFDEVRKRFEVLK